MSAVLGWGVSGTSPRLRVPGLPLVVPPSCLYMFKRPHLRPLWGRGAIRAVVGPSPPPLLYPAPVARGPSRPPPLRSAPAVVVGGKGVRYPALGGGAFLSADALGALLRAGRFAPAFVGLGAGFSPVASPAVLASRWSSAAADDAPCVSLASQPSARCVLPAVVRARVLAPSAPAPTCDNSKSTFKIYRAILYRTIDDFDFDFKLSTARRPFVSSWRFAPLTHPPPCERIGGGHCPSPLNPLASVFHGFWCYRTIKKHK